MADIANYNEVEQVALEETSAVHEMNTSGIDNPDTRDNDVEQVELEETTAVHEMKTSEGIDNPEDVDLLLVLQGNTGVHTLAPAELDGRWREK